MKSRVPSSGSISQKRPHGGGRWPAACASSATIGAASRSRSTGRISASAASSASVTGDRSVLPRVAKPRTRTASISSPAARMTGTRASSRAVGDSIRRWYAVCGRAVTPAEPAGRAEAPQASANRSAAVRPRRSIRRRMRGQSVAMKASRSLASSAAAAPGSMYRPTPLRAATRPADAQLLIRLGDRQRVDRELAGERADRGQRLGRAGPAVDDPRDDEVADLEIDRSVTLPHDCGMAVGH